MAVFMVMISWIVIGAIFLNDKVRNGIANDKRERRKQVMEDFKEKYCDSELQKQLWNKYDMEEYKDELQAEISECFAEYESLKHYKVQKLPESMLFYKKFLIDVLLANRGKVSTWMYSDGYRIHTNDHEKWEKEEFDFGECLQKMYKKQGIDLELYVIREKCDLYSFGWLGSMKVPYGDKGFLEIERKKFSRDLYDVIGKPIV